MREGIQYMQPVVVVVVIPTIKLGRDRSLLDPEALVAYYVTMKHSIVSLDVFLCN